MYEKSQDTTSDDSSCGCNCSHAVKMTHQNVQTFVGDIRGPGNLSVSTLNKIYEVVLINKPIGKHI